MSQPHPTPRRFGRVLVYGLGLSGRAALSLLAARGTGELLAADDRPAGEIDLSGLPDVKVLAGEQVPSTLPEGVEAVVLSPGVPHDKPLLEDVRRRGVPVLAEVELAFPEARGPIVGITGSNGKSTTTALTGATSALPRNLRQSMRNGGGPACLRLRIVMTSAERAAAAAFQCPGRSARHFR